MSQGLSCQRKLASRKYKLDASFCWHDFKLITGLFFTLSFATPTYAQPNSDGVGQTIQIYTQLHSFVGKPSWLLIIRDIDHNQNIPYLFDITRADNFWLAFTYSRNYVVEASTLQFAPYHTNPYTTRSIHNFCHLESQGRIQRGESMYVMVRGDLSPYTNTFSCNVSRYGDTNFTIYEPDSGN